MWSNCISPSITSLDPLATPQTYGSVAPITARVTPTDATGTVTFKDGATVLGVVRSGWEHRGRCLYARANPVDGDWQSSFHCRGVRGRESGGDLVGYSGSVSTSAPLSITPKAVTLAGTKAFDGSPDLNLSGATDWVVGNLDGAALTVSGIARLSGRNGGATTIQVPPATQRRDLVAGHKVSAAVVLVSSMTLTMPAAPAYGNTLVATIAYKDAADTDQIYSITQVGSDLDARDLIL